LRSGGCSQEDTQGAASLGGRGPAGGGFVECARVDLNVVRFRSGLIWVVCVVLAPGESREAAGSPALRALLPMTSVLSALESGVVAAPAGEASEDPGCSAAFAVLAVVQWAVALGAIHGGSNEGLGWCICQHRASGLCGYWPRAVERSSRGIDAVRGVGAQP